MPFIPTDDDVAAAKVRLKSAGDDRKQLERAVSWAEKMVAGEPFLNSGEGEASIHLANVFVSVCFNCDRPSLWIHDRLVYPPTVTGDPPNMDMPDDIRHDYEEARSILALSPRGAAALLRLAVQKLCRHLGEPGVNIDSDIATLVRKGLDQMTAEALDSVRVIGNQAVHPGQMDLRDDQETAAELFYAVNFIVDQMITKKKKLAEIYAKLPLEKRAAIDVRNAKAIKAVPSDGSV